MKFRFRGSHDEQGEYDRTYEDVIDFTIAAEDDPDNPDPAENLRELEELTEDGDVYNGYAKVARDIYNQRKLGKN